MCYFSAGLHRSFSGSEASTDVSVSSNENLASGPRQEPQGEETQVSSASLSYDVTGSSEYSILERLGMPSCEVEKLQCAANPPQIYVTPGNHVYSHNMTHGPFIATSVSSPLHHGGLNQMLVGQSHNMYQSNESGFSSASSKHKLGDSGSNQSLSVASGFSCDSSPNCTRAAQASQHQTTTLSSSANTVCSYNSSTLYANYPQHHWAHAAMDPSLMISGQHDLSHLHHSGPGSGSYLPHHGLLPQQLPGHYYTSNPLPPPPDYPGQHHPTHHVGHTTPGMYQEAARRSYEFLGSGRSEIPGSRSQPDLNVMLGHSGQHIIHSHGGSGSDRGSQHSLEMGYVTFTIIYCEISFFVEYLLLCILWVGQCIQCTVL